MRIMTRLTVLAALVAFLAGSLSSYGDPTAEHTVKGRKDEVQRKDEKNGVMEDTNPEVIPTDNIQEIENVETVIIVSSVPFKFDKSKFIAFKEFPKGAGDPKATHIDLRKNPDGLTAPFDIRRPVDNSTLLQFADWLKKDVHDAGTYPIHAEGNLVKKPGSGQEGEEEEEEPLWHWAGKIDGVQGVDIDVDWNRNSRVEDKEDDAKENDPVLFKANDGALMLVNCDRDAERLGEARDMDDNQITNSQDLEDMSPISLELERDLKPSEELYLVIENSSGEGKIWANVMDKELMRFSESGHALVGHFDGDEVRLDRRNIDGVEYFPQGKKIRYDDRFFVEGLRFAEEITIKLEIREGGKVIERDSVKMLNCPWLANTNVQKLATVQPGNLVNSRSYPFNADHGAAKTQQGDGLEFVQDSCEWGYQTRRHMVPASSRTMITALRLYTEKEDQHPLRRFMNEEVGVYGYSKQLDEEYYAKNSGDQGGNLECIPIEDEGYPFGRILYGDTMSPALRGFLDKQKAQVPAAVISISKLDLAHVDEFVCIVPRSKGGYLAVTPDWEKAKNLMRKNRRYSHNVPGIQPDGAPKELETYGEILAFLKGNPKGQALDTKMRAVFLELKKEVAAVGKQASLPGMFLQNTTAPLHQRSFPRSIANSQPTKGGILILSEPPKEERNNKQRTSCFLTFWQKNLKKIGVTGEPENTFFAWRKGGEAHCASNAIREPLVK